MNNLYVTSSLLKFIFADKTAYTASGTDLDNLIHYVDGEMKKMARKFHVNEMAVNLSKTKVPVAGLIPTVTPRYCTITTRNALRSTKKKFLYFTLESKK
jgi:hypothetical protein